MHRQWNNFLACRMVCKSSWHLPENTFVKRADANPVKSSPVDANSLCAPFSKKDAIVEDSHVDKKTPNKAVMYMINPKCCVDILSRSLVICRGYFSFINAFLFLWLYHKKQNHCALFFGKTKAAWQNPMKSFRIKHDWEYIWRRNDNQDITNDPPSNAL